MPFLSSAPLRLDIVRYPHYGLKRRSPLSLIAPATERMGAKTCHGHLIANITRFTVPCKYLFRYYSKGEYRPRNLVGIVTCLSLTGLAPLNRFHDGSVGPLSCTNQGAISSNAPVRFRRPNPCPRHQWHRFWWRSLPCWGLSFGNLNLPNFAKKSHSLVKYLWLELLILNVHALY